jgi:hypothetical protein
MPPLAPVITTDPGFMSTLAAEPAAARGAQVNRKSDYKPNDWPEGPVTAEPVMDRRIPEKGHREKYEADNRPENIVEDPSEPMSEDPEERDDQTWGSESQQSQQAWHDSEFLARSALRSGRFQDLRS